MDYAPSAHCFVNRQICNLLAPAVAAVIITFAGIGTALAQSYQYWAGAAANDNWSSTANWRSNTIPASNDLVYFDTPTSRATARYDLTPQAGLGHGLIFTDAATGFTVTAANGKPIPIRHYVEQRATSGENWVIAPLDFRPIPNRTTGSISVGGGRLELLGDVMLPLVSSDPANNSKAMQLSAARNATLVVTRLVGEVAGLTVGGAGLIRFRGHSQFDPFSAQFGGTGSSTTVRIDENAIIELTASPVLDVWLGNTSSTFAPGSRDRLELGSNARFTMPPSTKLFVVGYDATLAVLPVNTNTLPARLDANVRMTSTATLAININNPASYSFLHATSLRPAGKLEVYLPLATSTGTTLTLVQRDFPLNDPRYVFDGLPDGGTFDSPDNGRSYRISYAGGATGNDIVLTDIGSAAVAPSAPSRLRLASLPGALGATFDAPLSNGDAPILDYRITCFPGNLVRTVSGSSATLTSLSNGTRYSCTVAARNRAGFSAESAGAEGTPIAPPSAPQNLRAQPGPGSVSLHWEPPSDNGGAAIGEYVVTCVSGSQSATVTTATTTLDIAGLQGGGTYVCTVQARNAAGLGPAASSAPLIVLATPVPTISHGVSEVLSLMLVALVWLRTTNKKRGRCPAFHALGK